MEHHLLGQACALGAAITWAGALVLFKRSGEHFPPIGLNLFKNTVALVLLGLTLPVLMKIDPGHDIARLGDFPPADYCILLLSGIIGIALADTVFFYALNLIGVGLISIVDCMYSPSVLLVAWLMLGEKLGTLHYVGGGAILLGIFIASRHKPPGNRSPAQILFGILLTLFALVSMAVGVVMAKPVFEPMPLIWATTIRLAGGTVGLALFARLGRGWRANWTVFRPSHAWKYALPGSVLGTYLALVFWIAGFKYTHASVAAVLNQTSVIFSLILATVFLKEPFGGRKLAAVVLGMTGVIIITFSDRLTTRSGWLAFWPVWLTALLVPAIYAACRTLRGPRPTPSPPADESCVVCGQSLEIVADPTIDNASMAVKNPAIPPKSDPEGERRGPPPGKQKVD